jgi:hypothetical protein
MMVLLPCGNLVRLLAADTGSVNVRLCTTMDRLTVFGLFAVTAMLVCYALEQRSTWFILAFAAACVLGSAYGFLQGAWPFGLVEAVWSVVALRRWLRTNTRESA